jgi:alpha-L-fucosidase 2
MDLYMKAMPIILKSLLKRLIALAFIICMTKVRLYGQPVPDIAPWLAANNVTWTNPGPTSSQSMPLGNGDIGLNVWAETNGAVDFYIGKSDSWGDSVQGSEGLLKLGGVHITMNPNPLTPGVPFQQTLMLDQGQIQITEGSGANSVNLLLWVDASNPVVRVQATSGGTPVTLQATLLDWRLTNSPPGVNSPDVVLTGQTNYIGWFHQNSLSDAPQVANWIMGAIIQGSGMTNTSSTNLASTPVTSQIISVYPLTVRTGTASQWLSQLQTNISQINALNYDTTFTNSEAWWDAFWHRSWIYATGSQSATNTTEGYVLQRFVSACAGRGAYPIHFNGSLFVVDNPAVPYTPDGRTWGGQYWMQNTREMYWPMLASGDFDMMQPFFNMYAQIISNNMAQVESYYGQSGSYSAETSPFWGGLQNVSTNAIPIGSGSLFTDRYFEGVLELSMMMLDYYDYTGNTNTNFLVKTLLPAASAGLTFYDQHFGLDNNGKMDLYPVNSLETYWDAYDPAPDIAGLTAVLPRLLALPTNYVSTAQQSQWARMLGEIPPLPVGTNEGNLVLLPYTGPQTNTIENGENTQLYAIFPYRVYGFDKPNLSVAISSYDTRLFYGLGWADWMPDAIQSAMIGLASQAEMYTVYNMTNTDPSLKFQAFWREQNDYMPSEDTGGVGEDALQKMIMACDGTNIMLLPAWPAGWNAIFNLNAPYNTTVQGTITNGLVTNLVVTPSSRLANVIFMNGQGSPPAAPMNLTAMAANGQIELNWSTSPNTLDYEIMRSLSNGGPYAVIATNFSGAAYTDTSVVSGTTYYYVVSAVNPAGISPDSSQTNATASLIIPTAPTGLTATPGNGKIALSWNASSGATSYNVKRSTSSGGDYTTIANWSTTYYTDTGLTNGTTYYYVVSAQNTLGESGNSVQISAATSNSSGNNGGNPLFSSGTFQNNSVLTFAGTPLQELYGISLGDGTAHITANGYTFSDYPNTNISYGGSSAYSVSGFLGGGGSSGDTAFDTVLNDAELGINIGTLTLNNLTEGMTYNVLFLESDTRNVGGPRAWSMTAGSVTSPDQSYAFQGGTPSLGGYILCTFVASGTTLVFTNDQGGYGYQLNAVLVENAPTNTSALITGISYNGTSISVLGTNGPAGGMYRILTSTNLAAPLTLWIPVATNYFNSKGAFTFTNLLNPVATTIFFRLVAP